MELAIAHRISDSLKAMLPNLVQFQSRDVTDIVKENFKTTIDEQSKRVLYLNANLWFGVKAGGSVGHISGVVNGFLKQGFALDYVAAYPNETISPKAAFHLLDPPRRYGLPYELNYFRFHRDIVQQVEKIIKKKDYRFIYQRMSIDNYSGVTLSRKSGIPLILEYNCSEAWAAKNWGKPLRFHDLAVSAEEVCLRHAHLIVTISDVLRDELLGRGIPPHRIVTYPNCIDPEVFDPGRFSEEEVKGLRHKYNIPADSKVVTFVGTFGRWHGVDKLAEAINTIAEGSMDWVKKNKVRFLVIGDGMMMPRASEILAPAVRKGIATLTGLIPQTDAPLHLAASDILVSPHVENADKSRFFGSPTKLFEYMAMGKGIVASDLEQIGEVLSNSLRADNLPQDKPGKKEDRLALLTTPGDVAGLVRGIKFLVERDDWSSALGRNVRSEALSKYTWVRHVDAILSGFDKIYGRQQKALAGKALNLNPAEYCA